MRRGKRELRLVSPQALRLICEAHRAQACADVTEWLEQRDY